MNGNVAGGGTFNITTDAGTEYLLLAGVGHRFPFSQSWSVNSYIGVIHHITDWKVRDTISGNSGSVDDYTNYVLTLGVDYSFYITKLPSHYK